MERTTIFRKLTSGLLLAGSALFFNPANAQHVVDASIEGRWDITVDMGGNPRPSWLEVTHSGNNTLVGQFCSVSGSARPISKVNFTGGKLSFSIPPQWESGNQDFSVEGTMADGKFTGTLTTPSGSKHNWTGVRAPSLKRTAAPVWGTPIKLISGNDTKGWHATGNNQWVVENGVLRSPKSGANLITDQKFNDFKLHVEFRVPKESNSGVYLRGRYEVQVADSKGKEALKDEMGAIYGFLVPSEQMAKDPGEWQTMDITLIGRMVSLVINGKPAITNQAIPGITGGALDSNEGEPGPIFLQGDHGPVEYRNLVITPAK